MRRRRRPRRVVLRPGDGRTSATRPTALRRLNPALAVRVGAGVPRRRAPRRRGSRTAAASTRRAASGVVGGDPQPSLLAYPDPLAGLLAFGAVARRARRAGRRHDVDVSLAAAIGAAAADGRRAAGAVDDDAIVDRLRRRDGRPPGRRHRRRREPDGLGDEVDRVAHRQRRPRRGASRTRGWRWRRRVAPDRAVGPADGGHLAVADRAGQRRLQRRVGAAGAAAQPVVVELDDVGDVAEHGAHRLVGPLDVAEVARVLDDHRAERGAPAPAAGRRAAPATPGRRRPAPRTPPPPACRAGARSPSSPRRTRPS